MLGKSLRYCLGFVSLLVTTTAAQGWQSLADQADSLRIAGRADSAIVLMELVLAQHATEWTPTDTALATSLYRLAYIAFNKYRFQKALSLVEPAVSIRERYCEPLNPMLARALNTKGASCWALGQTAQARILLERVINIWEKSPEPDSLSLLTSLINYAAISNEQHRFATAMQCFQRCLTICDRRPDLARDYRDAVNNNLNNVYLSLGRYTEAIAGFEKELAALEGDTIHDGAMLVVCLENLAQAHAGLGHNTEAADLLSRAMEIEAAQRGEESPSVAYVLSMQASLNLRLGNYDRARALCEKTLAIQKNTYGSLHPDVASSLSLYAGYWCLAGDQQRAMTHGKSAFDIIHDNFSENCWVMTETEALQNSVTLRTLRDKYLSYFQLSNGKEPGSLEQAADVIFASKGVVSDEIFLRNRGLIREDDIEIRELADKLRKAKRRLSRLFSGGPPSQREIPLLQIRRDSLSRVCDDLESKLAARSFSYREATSSRQIDAARIARNLPPNSALVEYLEYRFIPPSSTKLQSRYLGVLLTSDGVSKIEDLGTSSSIDSLVSEYRKCVTAAAAGWPDLDEELREKCDSALKTLYQMVWMPFATDLATKENILIAPDGTLNLVSFATLKKDDGTYLIEEHPLHYLCAGRDLLRIQGSRSPGYGLLALGDPDFCAGSPDVDERRDVPLSPLPYTRREINDIADAWLKRSGEPCCLLLGSDAREERFKQEARGKKVLHLATHGFFHHADESVGADVQDFVDGIPSLQNPLLNSGLYLSGAEARGKTMDDLEADDGILTGYEVTDLDLTTVSWVVLSACESGLGDVRVGEGVYGLRRAFLLAGARTVISALWQIDDHEAARVMRQLYLSPGNNLATTMRDLALNRIADMRAKGLPDNPGLWGAFIAVGDWRTSD